jgi:low temperature requirement protein LtrA
LNFRFTEFSEVRTQKKGAGQALIVLLAVWWSWNYTTWTTNDRFRYKLGCGRRLLLSYRIGLR